MTILSTIILIFAIYMFLGYFVVSYYHRNCERLTSVGLGIFAMFIWPIVIITFSISKLPDNLVDKIFGEGK